MPWIIIVFRYSSSPRSFHFHRVMHESDPDLGVICCLPTWLHDAVFSPCSDLGQVLEATAALMGYGGMQVGQG